jgi:glutamate---cysteine ligase / carboxylate-amine ligase
LAAPFGREGRRSGHIVDDASFIWWMVRPSPKYPTLELRATDCCTRIEDAIAIAALYRVLVRHLYTNPRVNAEVDVTSRALAAENKWRARRYGVQGSFVTQSGHMGVADYLEEVLEMTAEDARALECEEVADCRRIVAGGTSADGQLAVFHAHSANGRAAALKAAIEWIGQTTLGGMLPSSSD